MEANKAYLIKKNIISVEGQDREIFLQNIITNDIYKLKNEKSIYAALLSPQGKIMFDFIIIRHDKKFLIEIDRHDAKKLFEKLMSYKLRSKVEVKVNTNLLSLDIHENIFKKISSISENFYLTFEDPRIKKLSFRVLIDLNDLLIFSDKFSVHVINKDEDYCKKMYESGIPPFGFTRTFSEIFALEANFKETNGIEFKKGCYIGQENMARMNLKNKINKRLIAIKILNGSIAKDQNILHKKSVIGKIVIDGNYPFALIKINEENKKEYFGSNLNTETSQINLLQTKFF